MQTDIREWWEANPMSYDWRRTNPYEEGTIEWFAEVDRIFFDRVSSFFAHRSSEKPFSKLIPYSSLKGKDVLEIGCGSGAHARLMLESGARLTAVDLTEKAIYLTQTRLSQAGLSGAVLQMDANSLEFDDNSFDFVWSWGVIHHSENTQQIVNEIARVLRPGGEARVMVYHRRSIYVGMMIAIGLLTGRLFRHGTKQILNHYSDGLIANFYTAEEFKALFRPRFTGIQDEIFGQKNELIPLPGGGPFGRAKRVFAQSIPEAIADAILSRFGRFLFVRAVK